MQKRLSVEERKQRSIETLEGLRRARREGRVGGRRQLYTDDQIRQALALYEAGASWRRAAEAVVDDSGRRISIQRLQARIRQLCPTN